MDLPLAVFENITPELASALAQLQGDLPRIERDRHVDVETKDPSKAYGYSYATLAHVTEQIMPKLSKYGLSYTGFPGACSDGKMGLRYYLLHASGGWIRAEFPLSGEGGIQVLGGRITYAKRYCLLAVTGLAAEEDDDAARAQAEDEASGRTAQRRKRTEEARTNRAAEATSRRAQRAQTPTPDPGDPAAGAERAVSGPREPGEPASRPQQQKLVMQFKDLNISDRAERLNVVSRLMGRQVGSVTELNSGEAHDLINTIDGHLGTAEGRDLLLSYRATQTTGDTPTDGPQTEETQP